MKLVWFANNVELSDDVDFAESTENIIKRRIETLQNIVSRKA